MASRDDSIADLRAIVEKQSKQIEELTQKVAELELQLAKAKKDSSNSSKSPSSDITKPKKPQPKPGRPRKRRAGGQAGHERNLCRLLPPERVTETVDHELDAEESLLH